MVLQEHRSLQIFLLTLRRKCQIDPERSADIRRSPRILKDRDIIIIIGFVKELKRILLWHFFRKSLEMIYFQIIILLDVRIKRCLNKNFENINTNHGFIQRTPENVSGLTFVTNATIYY